MKRGRKTQSLSRLHKYIQNNTKPLMRSACEHYVINRLPCIKLRRDPRTNVFELFHSSNTADWGNI